MGKTRWELSVLLCDNPNMKELNSTYRGIDSPTDVLSFNQDAFPAEGGIRVAGDIVISMDMLQENAREFRVTPNEELKRLLIHGMLHLVGMDHDEDGDNGEMLRSQESLVASVSGVKLL